MTPANRISIRTAREDDEAALADLDVTSWTPQAGFPSVLERMTARGGFFTPDSPPKVHMVACLADEAGAADGTDGRIVGYVRVTPPTPLPENAHVLLISGIAVHRDARRQGVAARLLEAAEAYAAERGARKLSLRVLGSNDAALRLYEKAGFEREGTLRDEFLIDGAYVDDVLMTRRLCGAAAVTLNEITDENRAAVLALSVAPRQDRFVSSVRESLAEAAEYPHANPWYRAVCADGEAVGFVMVSWNAEPHPPEIIGPWFLWKLLIDERHQGRGYGSEVVRQVVELVRAEGARELLTSYVPEDGGPAGFYQKLGFVPTGDVDENGEIIMRLALP